MRSKEKLEFVSRGFWRRKEKTRKKKNFNPDRRGRDQVTASGKSPRCQKRALLHLKRTIVAERSGWLGKEKAKARERVCFLSQKRGELGDEERKPTQGERVKERVKARLDSFLSLALLFPSLCFLIPHHLHFNPNPNPSPTGQRRAPPPTSPLPSSPPSRASWPSR